MTKTACLSLSYLDGDVFVMLCMLGVHVSTVSGFIVHVIVMR